jgi:hypothetical protein
MADAGPLAPIDLLLGVLLPRGLARGTALFRLGGRAPRPRRLEHADEVATHSSRRCARSTIGRCRRVVGAPSSSSAQRSQRRMLARRSGATQPTPGFLRWTGRFRAPTGTHRVGRPPPHCERAIRARDAASATTQHRIACSRNSAGSTSRTRNARTRRPVLRDWFVASRRATVEPTRVISSLFARRATRRASRTNTICAGMMATAMQAPPGATRSLVLRATNISIRATSSGASPDR